jgi:CDP-diacylglycerol---glycerol-3-phosphate 3-phosphatidyltransferase
MTHRTGFAEADSSTTSQDVSSSRTRRPQGHAARRPRLLGALLPNTKLPPNTGGTETLWNPANAITAGRTVLCICLLAIGAAGHSSITIYMAVGAQWFLDFLDGFVARLLGCETRFGACFDAQSDRLISSVFLLAAWQLWPQSRPAIVLCLAYMILLDGAMFAQAMRSGVLSTNYYYIIDRQAWRVCWSPGAKFVTAVVAPVLVLMGNPSEIAAAAIGAAALVRVPFLKRVLIDNCTGRSI